MTLVLTVLIAGHYKLNLDGTYFIAGCVDVAFIAGVFI